MRSGRKKLGLVEEKSKKNIKPDFRIGPKSNSLTRTKELLPIF